MHNSLVQGTSALEMEQMLLRTRRSSCWKLVDALPRAKEDKAALVVEAVSGTQQHIVTSGVWL
jgi:hypothetical protein